MFNAKVTVGIRTYNVSSYVEECLNSVYNQTIKNDIRVVLVDDCSTDETLIILDKWLDEH
jgi:glycosyltransferase involved in cell wall biosynthesis